MIVNEAAGYFSSGSNSLAVAASFPFGSSSRYFWKCSFAAAFLFKLKETMPRR